MSSHFKQGGVPATSLRLGEVLLRAKREAKLQATNPKECNVFEVIREEEKSNSQEKWKRKEKKSL
jgi:hypothetical protein